MKTILLGYEIGTGDPVDIPLHHLVVTGMTRLSGKTTTLEALIARSGLKALAFRTKRGESGFEGAHRVQPFFRERADWQYIQGLLEATMREKMRFERSWIIKACKGARSLRDVYERIVAFLTPDEKGRVKLRGIDEGIYTNLRAYMEIVIPELERTPFARDLLLRDGVNVMDLEGLRQEVQVLVVASSLQELYEHGRDTIVVIPEVWKFCPEGRGSPAKLPIEQLIREGAAVGLWLFFDSQDISGADKRPLKQCDNWILGRQKETNEVEHTLDQIPLSKKLKPPPEAIMQLKLGHFVACYDDVVKKVYARPTWVDEETAIAVAKGKMKVTEILRRKVNVDMEEEQRKRFEEIIADQKQTIAKQDSELSHLRYEVEKWKGLRDSAIDARHALQVRAEKAERKSAPTPIPGGGTLGGEFDDGGAFGPPPGLGRELKVGSLAVDAIQREAVITYSRELIEFSTATVKGKIVFTLLEEFKNAPSTETEIADAMREHGWNYPHKTMAPELAKLVKNGELMNDGTKPARYRLPGKIEIRIKDGPPPTEPRLKVASSMR